MNKLHEVWNRLTAWKVQPHFLSTKSSAVEEWSPRRTWRYLLNLYTLGLTRPGRRQGSSPDRIWNIARKCFRLRVCRCIHRRIVFQRKGRLEKRALSSENWRNVQSNAAFVWWMNCLLSKCVKRAQNIPTYCQLYFSPVVTIETDTRLNVKLKAWCILLTFC